MSLEGWGTETLEILPTVPPPSVGRGWYGDFEKLKPRQTTYTTAQNMCLGHPKRPRSLPDSTLDPGYASHKPVQKVRTPHPRWHNVTRDLMHACKLSSMCRAAAQSTRTPGTDPARLKLTTCTCPRPTSPKLFKCTHDNDMHWGQAQERHTSTTMASGATRAPRARKWPTRILGRSSSADRRLDLQQVLRGLSNAR